MGLMLNNYYINNFVIYTKSGSMTADGTYVEATGSGLTGKCRIDPVTDNEGYSSHKIFMASCSLGHVDTITVDKIHYEIKGINLFFDRTSGHHFEIDAMITTRKI
jgi:hypothetical protein